MSANQDTDTAVETVPVALSESYDTWAANALGSSTGNPAPDAHRRRRKAGVAMLALAAILGIAWRWWVYTHTWAVTDNAYLAGHILTISPRIAGTVSEVLVDDNQDVAAGAVLARLDAADLNVQRDKAKAEIAQAEAQLARARAQVVRDEAGAGKAEADFDRADRLFHKSSGVISQADFDAARTTLESARGALDASRADALAAGAQVQVAAAQLADVSLQLDYTDIVAPASGRVGRKNIEPGNRVLPGQALMALVTPEIWVIANFKETQLARLHPGQTVKLTVDGLPGEEFTGRVETFAPASGAQFALLPPDNATGNFTKVVQRVPVKIVFTENTPGTFAGRMVPGMSVIAKVRLRD
ncbi:MAG: HlyD family secretion protein [Chthoniobacterales bacterium]|nr:HlyD family secretion protein [Chthoniobacterales bacterium]